MFLFDFLEGPVPLTKTFRRTEAGYDVAPYPLVRNVTSHRREAKDLTELLAILQQHAALGHCQLKGLLTQQIQNQSRAGLTQAEADTRWLLLDLDFTDGWANPAEFLDQLDPRLKGVSFIFQHSSSAGITGRPGLRGHVWVLLSAPAKPSILKVWLRDRNLQVPGLSQRISLSANGQSLKWPLDISTCQNDKLIYIAPPVCEGFDDPIAGKRFELHIRKKDFAEPPQFTQSMGDLTRMQDQRIAQLREAAGLPKRKAKYQTLGTVEVLSNPDEAVVTGMKTGRGFVYLNLNGGDSWAYYFPIDKPEIVYNFKGEPNVRLKDIAPDFYKQYTATLRQMKNEQQRDGKELRPFVFRDRARDTYYNAIYYPQEDRVEFSKAASLQRLQHFLLQYNEVPPEVIEDWTVEFDPTQGKIVDFEKHWLNTFNPSPYMRNKELKGGTAVPPLVDRILTSICAGNEEAKQHFLNWLAFIYQFREKATTAWVFHGVQGTGKGMLVSRVLKPLFGPEHVVEISTQSLEDQFNAQMERALILWLDEFHIESARNTSLVMNKLKNIVTEDRIILRGMRQDPVMVRNFANLIIATNHNDPIQLTTHDRRFNVAPAQETPMKPWLQAEIDQLEREIADFAAFLASYPVDRSQVRRVLLNDARENMIVASQTTIDRFFHAVRVGDLGYFMKFLESSMPMADTLFYAEFENALARWGKAALEGRPCAVSVSELKLAYMYMLGSPTSPAKFNRICAIHRLPVSAVNVNGKTVQGTTVLWNGITQDIQRFLNARNQLPKPQIIRNDQTKPEERPSA